MITIKIMMTLTAVMTLWIVSIQLYFFLSDNLAKNCTGIRLLKYYIRKYM